MKIPVVLVLKIRSQSCTNQFNSYRTAGAGADARRRTDVLNACFTLDDLRAAERRLQS